MVADIVPAMNSAVGIKKIPTIVHIGITTAAPINPLDKSHAHTSGPPFWRRRRDTSRKAKAADMRSSLAKFACKNVSNNPTKRAITNVRLKVIIDHSRKCG